MHVFQLTTIDHLLEPLRDKFTRCLVNGLSHVFAKTHFVSSNFSKSTNDILVSIVHQPRCPSVKLPITLCSKVDQSELVDYILSAIFYGYACQQNSP